MQRVQAPTLAHPVTPGNHAIDQSMFVFHTSFGGKYPAGNAVVIDGWTFEDLGGNSYTAQNGTLGIPGDGTMASTSWWWGWWWFWWWWCGVVWCGGVWWCVVCGGVWWCGVMWCSSGGVV